MSRDGTEQSDSAQPEETDLLLPSLPEEMKRVGMDAAKVDEFMELLKQCNVCTRGALRLFADNCPVLVNMMYGTEGLGPMQASGFLAALRVGVSCSNRQWPVPTPFHSLQRSPLLTHRMWLFYLHL